MTRVGEKGNEEELEERDDETYLREIIQTCFFVVGMEAYILVSIPDTRMTRVGSSQLPY